VRVLEKIGEVEPGTATGAGFASAEIGRGSGCRSSRSFRTERAIACSEQRRLPSPRSNEEQRSGRPESASDVTPEAVYLRRREFLQNTAAFAATMTIDQSAGGGEPSRGTPHQIVCERSHCPRRSSERDLIFPKGISANAIAARKPTTRDDGFAPR
jgi:hypothetical protein